MRYLTKMMLGGLLGALASTATAQSAAVASAPAEKAAAVEKTAQAAWPAPAPAAKLDGQRGGADTVSTQASLNATVADNTARNVVTGNNVIDNGSFANMNGLPMVIQNTGANVLIQNATVINLQMR